MRALIALLIVFLLPFPARSATSFAPDISGLWWNPVESGWGVNLIQQGSTIFATFFGHTCAGMTSGDFVLSEIEVSAQGFSAKLAQTFMGCTRSGTFGGPRATVP